jgi:hypothetical protein
MAKVMLVVMIVVSINFSSMERKYSLRSLSWLFDDLRASIEYPEKAPGRT